MDFVLFFSPCRPNPLSIQDVFEFEPLDDAETEHAVQALQRQGLSLSAHFSSRCGSPVAPGLGSPSPEVLFPLANPTSLPPDIQPLTPDTDCQRPESPTMPVLDAEPQAHDAAGLPSDAQHVPPCPDRLSPLPDPYTLPPVLSPQVPYPCENMELHSSYSDPPVLSPQQYTGEEPMEGHTCEVGGAELVFESVAPPNFTPFLCHVALTTAREVKGSSLGSRADLSRDSLCSTKELKCSTPCSQRSRSLPRQSATAHNPRKRCRSASPQRSWSKRRRTAVKTGSGDGGNESVKPLSDIMAKQTLSMFCLPALQNLSQAGNQSDTSGHGCASRYNQPSCPLPLKDKNFDPSHLLPCDKSQRAFSSQDSQLSLSLSTSMCIEPALIPDLAGLSSSSSDSDWDCGLLSRLGPASAAPLPPAELGCGLDKELLHRPCTWMHDTSYESRLHSALQSQTAGTSLCGDEMDSSAFSRTLFKIVEVKHWRWLLQRWNSYWFQVVWGTLRFCLTPPENIRQHLKDQQNNSRKCPVNKYLKSSKVKSIKLLHRSANVYFFMVDVAQWTLHLQMNLFLLGVRRPLSNIAYAFADCRLSAAMCGNTWWYWEFNEAFLKGAGGITQLL